MMGDLFTRAVPPASFVVSNEAFSSGLNALYDCLQDCNDGERGLLLALTKMGVEVKGE